MNIAKTFRTFSRTGGAINIIRAAAFILLTVPASAQIPPEAKMLELTFQEQERKINDAAGDFQFACFVVAAVPGGCTYQLGGDQW